MVAGHDSYMLLTCSTWDIDLKTAESIAQALDVAVVDGVGSGQLLPAISSEANATGFSTIAALAARLFEDISPDDTDDTLGMLSEELAEKVCYVFEMTDEIDIQDMKFVANLLAADFAPEEEAGETLEELGRERVLALLVLFLSGMSLMLAAADDMSGGDPVRDAARMHEAAAS